VTPVNNSYRLGFSVNSDSQGSFLKRESYNSSPQSDMPTDDARNLLDSITSEDRKAHLRFRFESADGSLIAKIDGFIGRNALGELLIKSHPKGRTASFELKLGLDFTCDYADVSSAFPDFPRAIRLRFTNGDILLELGAR
jgi:hypothetical protein